MKISRGASPRCHSSSAWSSLARNTGDGRPTAQAYAAYERLSSELNGHLGKLNELLTTDAVRFNRLLTDRKLAPVETSRGSSQ